MGSIYVRPTALVQMWQKGLSESNLQAFLPQGSKRRTCNIRWRVRILSTKS
jgi:hypothetical protein